MLAGCGAPRQAASTAVLYVFRLDPPALLRLSSEQAVVDETPIAIPAGCTVNNLFAPQRGATLAIEFGCAFGPAVVLLGTASGKVRQPVVASDSHFMAWTTDGEAAYLKVDTVNRPHVIRVPIAGTAENLPISEFSYDLSPEPGPARDFLFSFSRGMGLGSEMWFARFDGRLVKQVRADARNYLSFARWSPDRSKIAFIRIPDSATPFTVGELWVMEADGSNARKLADADAGHGFAEAWSPDGSRIAFVVRENPQDAQADQDAGALQSNIAVVNVRDGSRSRVTDFRNARVEAPAWSPDGNSLAFTVVLNDKMNVYVADLKSHSVQSTLSVAACCPVWMQK